MPPGGAAQFVQPGQPGEGGLGGDPEVQQAGDLVHAHRAEPSHQGQALVDGADQRALAQIAGAGVVEQGLLVLGVKSAALTSMPSPRARFAISPTEDRR